MHKLSKPGEREEPSRVDLREGTTWKGKAKLTAGTGQAGSVSE